MRSHNQGLLAASYRSVEPRHEEPAARNGLELFSVAPVIAIVRPKQPQTAVAWDPRNFESRPQIESAAIRPCRLAGPAKGRKDHSPVTKSRTSTASPTAQT